MPVELATLAPGARQLKLGRHCRRCAQLHFTMMRLIRDDDVEVWLCLPCSKTPLTKWPAHGGLFMPIGQDEALASRIRV